jgi:hypothetical protein
VDLHGLIVCHSPIWDNISIPFILVGRLTTLLRSGERSAERSIGRKKDHQRSASSGTTQNVMRRDGMGFVLYANQKAGRN